LDLGEDKVYLVRQRLEPVAESEGCHSFEELAAKLGAHADERLRDKIIAAITTNESSFFRDGVPFDFFRSHLMPQLVALVLERKNRPFARKGPQVAILSAGASTGQEPYTLAMIIHEVLAGRSDVVPEDFSIVAVDISPRVLAQAISGEFREAEAQRGLTQAQRLKHFVPKGNLWVAGDHLKRIVRFQRVNLAEPFSYLGGFDFILCRNVLIYFNVETRRSIFEQFYSMLPDNGTLLLGSTENLYGTFDKFHSEYWQKFLHYKKPKTETPQASSPPTQTLVLPLTSLISGQR
jgi:chemotaxis protein methyltransferase CheR